MTAMDAVSVATLVLTAATFIAAVGALAYSIRADRRQRESLTVALTCDLYADIRDGHDNVIGVVWQLTNVGRSDAHVMHLVSAGCEIKVDLEHPPIRVLRAGESKRIRLAPHDPARAWLLLIWHHPLHRSFVTAMWYAPDRQAVQAVAGDAEPESWTGRWASRLPLPLRARLRKARAVGPGGAIGEHVSMRRARAERQIQQVQSLAMKARESQTRPST